MQGKRNTKWNAIRKSCGQISHVSFPRLVLSPNVETKIHGFYDAIIEAYGAYVNIVCNGQAHLLCSESRVAPLKTLTFFLSGNFMVLNFCLVSS